MGAKRAIDIVKASPHFVIPSLAMARKSAIGELSADLKEPVNLTRAQEEILELAVSAQHKHTEAMLSFWDLCMALRKHSFGPKEARPLLFAAGYVPSRVSEILTVVGSNDRVFNDYANRVTGFRLALAQARQDKKPLQSLLTLPDTFAPEVAHKFVELLGDRKKAAFEVEGVVITLSRSKPAEKQQKPAVKAKSTKGKSK